MAPMYLLFPIHHKGNQQNPSTIERLKEFKGTEPREDEGKRGETGQNPGKETDKNIRI